MDPVGEVWALQACTAKRSYVHCHRGKLVRARLPSETRNKVLRPKVMSVNGPNGYTKVFLLTLHCGPHRGQWLFDFFREKHLLITELKFNKFVVSSEIKF